MCKARLLVVLAVLFIFSPSFAKENIFKEQRIGIGYYPSLQGSQTFWLNYNVNKRNKKIIYSIKGMYGFRPTNALNYSNYAAGLGVSFRLFTLFKGAMDVRNSNFLGYVNFTYRKTTIPFNKYPLTYNGVALLPGLTLETDLTDRLGLRFGANGGVYYAKTKDAVYNGKAQHGEPSFTEYSSKALYYILLMDFSVTIKLTKNYLPHQR
jgi:hypothetical protein